jgi:hypothetical protein
VAPLAAAPAKIEPAKPAPAKIEPAKAELAKPTPPKAEVKQEAAKTVAAKSAKAAKPAAAKTPKVAAKAADKPAAQKPAAEKPAVAKPAPVLTVVSAPAKSETAKLEASKPAAAKPAADWAQPASLQAFSALWSVKPFETAFTLPTPAFGQDMMSDFTGRMLAATRAVGAIQAALLDHSVSELKASLGEFEACARSTSASEVVTIQARAVRRSTDSLTDTLKTVSETARRAMAPR